FNALNNLRRLAVHHGGVLGDNLREALEGLLPLVDSLRSSVSKNAVLTVADLFSGLGKACDAHLPSITAVLLRLGGTSNAFIGESAAMALKSMLDNCSDSRVLAALVAAAGHRKSGVASQAPLWLDAAAEVMGGGGGTSSPLAQGPTPRLNALREKEVVALLSVGARFAAAGAEETRHSAKRLLVRLHASGVASEGTLATLSERTADVVRGVWSKGLRNVPLASPTLAL
ncbi:Togaram1, partial [Symbiodinium sp. KB8]